MRKHMLAGFLSVLVSPTLFAQTHAAMEFSERPAQLDKQSYSIGVDIGKSLRGQAIAIDQQSFLAGFQDSFSGETLALSDAQVETEILQLQQQLVEKQMSEARDLAEKNRTEGERFLAENGTKEGVETLESGLQYEVIEQGSGPVPQTTDMVKVHYRGTLIDGTEFDSSYARQEPAVFPVTGVIPGWTEALLMMPAGSKWHVVIPSNLAYGEFGVGGVIGPNATLVFDIELLGIERS